MSERPQTEFFTLFDGASTETQSSTFIVLPGWAAELSAFGFRAELVPSTDGSGKRRQAACLHRVLMREQPFVKDPEICGVMLVMPKHKDDALAEGPIVIGGCPLQLSACDTTLLISWPGLYRLVLNDADAVSNVQIYLQSHVKAAVGPLWPPHFGVMS